MKEKVGMKQKGNKLQFSHFPQFAKWILENKLDEYSKLMLEYSRAEQIPILAFFSQYPDEKLIEMGRNSGTLLLSRIIENEAEEHINSTVKEWSSNKLETIDRESIVAEDIALISLVRRKVFRILLLEFAKDLPQFRAVMEEVDRFTAASDIATFNAYLHIQQEKMNALNEQLQEQQGKLLEAQQLAEIGSFYWDMEGKGRSVLTPMVLSIFEIEDASNLESFIQDVHPEDRDRLRLAISQAIENDGIYECEYRYSRNNKNKRIWSRGLVLYENGKAVGMKGTVMDTTLKSQLIEKLQVSEELHNQAQALTHIGNWSWHIPSDEITWSDEMYRIYGLAPQSEKINFARFMSLIHPDNRESRMQEIQRSLNTGEAEDYILNIVTPAGEEKVLKGKGEIITDSSGKPLRFNGTCQDITKEYKLNKALEEKEEYLALLINNAPDAVIVIDEESIITLWNPKTESIFGWKAEEVLGRQLTDTIIPPRYREAHMRGIRNYIATGHGNVMNRTTELTALNKRNEELFISLTISETIQDGKRSFIAFLRDITQEKQIEIELRNKSLLLEQRNIQLEHSNQELESFNYAASHDLQEPLRKIRIFANRIREEEEDISAAIHSYVNKIVSSSERMQSLIDDLLKFSQTTSPGEAEERVDLSDLLTEAMNVLAHQIEETGARITYAALPAIKAVPFQFQQLFINLLNNAIKYRKPGVPPEIWVGSVITSSQELHSEQAVIPGNYLKLSFADNGIGFDPQFSSRLFDLFARLHNKEKYSGTGIGLAICKKIVQNHQGWLRAESDGYSGSTFHIYLPEERVL